MEEIFSHVLARKDCVHIIMKNLSESDNSNSNNSDFANHKSDPSISEFTEAYVKDLRLLLHGRDLKDIVLVDDKVSSYAAQLDNGIPIPCYNGSEDDRALIKLKNYLLLHLKEAEDVRPILREHYINKVNDIFLNGMC